MTEVESRIFALYTVKAMVRIIYTMVHMPMDWCQTEVTIRGEAVAASATAVARLGYELCTVAVRSLAHWLITLCRLPILFT